VWGPVGIVISVTVGRVGENVWGDTNAQRPGQNLITDTQKPENFKDGKKSKELWERVRVLVTRSG